MYIYIYTHINMLNTHTLLFFWGGDVAFIQLRSYQDGACLQQWYHAADIGHDTSLRHSIQTQGRPVAVLSIDVERHTGIHSYPLGVRAPFYKESYGKS